MTALRAAIVLALALVLSGCFQTRTLVRLNADGSGTVEERVLMNSTMAMAVMMGGMSAMMGGEEAEGEMPDGPYTMEALEARAAAMGATFQSVEPEELLFGAGYTATYAFSDIGQLRLDTDPSSILPEDMGNEMGMGDDEEPAEPYTFAYDGHQLTVLIPEPEADEEETEALDALRDPKKQPMGGDDEAADNASELRQIAFVLRDMRFGLAIELPKAVAQTNAAHLDGQTLTLYDMDFGTLVQTPGALDAMAALDLDGPPSVSSGRGALADVPGMTVESGRTVTVTFE